MRILQTMAGAEFGGAEAFFTRLAIALQKTDVEQKVIIREDRGRSRILRAGGVEPVQLPFGGAFDFRTKMAIKGEIRRFKPDVVLTWMNRATKKHRQVAANLSKWPALVGTMILNITKTVTI